jgi:radical SAM protein with 4Fe4S-binding SPASM domain
MLIPLRQRAALAARLLKKLAAGEIRPGTLPYYFYFWRAGRGKLSHDQLTKGLRRRAEYVQVVEPVLAEINSAYEKFLFRAPAPQETLRHLIRFYKEFNTPARRVAAVREGNVLPHLGVQALKLQMDIVNQCNLRCIMCHFSSDEFSKRKKEEISVEDFKRIAAQLFPLCSHVSLSCGAEPLLHRNFGELLRITAGYKIPFVYMHTHALLLKEKTIEQLVRSRFGQLSISIDGATKQTYERIRVGAKFERLVANIEALNRAKSRMRSELPRLSFNVVLMRSNIEELPAIVRLAHELKVEGVAAVHMMPLSIAAVDPAEESLQGHKELCNRMLAEARKLAEQYRINVTFPEPFGAVTETAPLSPVGLNHRDLRFLPVRQTAAQPSCSFPWHFVRLDSGGNISPCGWWHDEPPMGNLLKESFAEIWNNEAYRRLRGEHMNGELRQVCRTCPAAGMGNVNSPSAFHDK